MTLASKSSIKWIGNVLVLAQFLIFVGNLSIAYSQTRGLDPRLSLSQYIVDSWETKDGLPQNAVQSVIQSSEGYIWLGTEEGIARFDGVRFVVFNKANTKAIGHNAVYAIAEGKDGSVWIGTLGGLTRILSDGETRSYSRQAGLSGDRVFSLHALDSGGLLIGTALSVDIWTPGDTIKSFQRLPGAFSINTIMSDGRDSVWVGDRTGLTVVTNGKLEKPKEFRDLDRFPVTCIIRDSKRRLWIAADGGGVRVQTKKQILKFDSRNGLYSDFVNTIYEDSRGSIWIGTKGGLSRITFDGASYTISKGFRGTSVKSVCEDHEGGLWLGTIGNGLKRLRQGKIIPFGVEEGLSDRFVRSILPSKDGGLWIGMSNGNLDRFKQGMFSHYPRIFGSGDIRALIQDQNGSLWVGVDGNGIRRISKNGVMAFDSKNGLLSDMVWALGNTSNGAIWIGPNQPEVQRYYKGKMESFTQENGYTDGGARCFLESRKGILWVGTSAGLVRYDGKIFRRYTVLDGLTSGIIMCLHEDSDGILWIGTYGGGLIKMNDERFHAYQSKDGLHNDAIFSIIEDRSRNFWMASNTGIFKVRKSDLDNYDSSRISSIPCEVFGVSDGMRNQECNGGSPSACMTKDGKLWFATLDGMAMIDVSAMRTNAVVPAVRIEEILVDHREVKAERENRFRPISGNVEFHYTAMSFLVPERVTFKYKLVGFDNEWVDAGRRRVAYYTNVPPGTFTFRVIACNDDGLWNLEGASVAIAIAPHYYQTWWFYGLILISFASVGAGGYHIYRQYRDKDLLNVRLQSRLVEAQLRALKMQLHPHFLFNTLNTISSYVLKDPRAALHMISRLSDFLRSSLDNEFVQKVELSKELDLLKRYLEIEKARFGTRLKVKFDVNSDTLKAFVPSLILQPIVENSIRHGISKRPGPGLIEISCRIKNERLELEVRDNGKTKISPSDDRLVEGIGLSNTRHRLRQMYGDAQQVLYHQEDNGGFAVLLTIPLEKQLDHNGSAK